MYFQKVFILFLVVLLTAGVDISSPAEDRFLSHNIQRIHDGEDVLMADYPFMVNLWWKKQFICGGTLISDVCVLTAEHCVRRDIAHQYSIYSSEGENMTEHKRKISRVITPDNPSLDIALILLNKRFTHEQASRIELDTLPGLEEGDDITVLGWGHSEYKTTNILRLANTTVLAPEICTFFYNDYYDRFDTVNEFCVDARKGPRACHGDSGGPAIHGGKQVGIVSRGSDKYDSGDPVVFTRLNGADVAGFLSKHLYTLCV